MPLFVYEADQVSVPSWVVDLDSFRRWAEQTEFPEEARVFFLDGQVWVDMSQQQAFTHVKVKSKFTITVGGLVETGNLGHFFPDGLMISNLTAEYAVVPDATFISHDTWNSDRVRLLEGKKEGGCVEIQGTPDMVLEIVSTSSVHKDNVVLRQAYWEAGIPEYWLVDARKEPLKFDILRHTAKGYVAARKQDGWVKSAVFGKSFRLTRRPDDSDHPEFTLEIR
jgi:hypothetical protein